MTTPFSCFLPVLFFIFCDRGYFLCYTHFKENVNYYVYINYEGGLTMFKPRRQLTAAVLLTCTSLLAPFYAQASQHTLKVDDSDPAFMQIYIDDMNKTFVNFQIDSKTTTGSDQYRDFLTDKQDIIGGSEKDAITSALIYTKELLGQPQTTPTITLCLLDGVSGIASANSSTIANGNTLLGEYFQNADANIIADNNQGTSTTIKISKLNPQWYAGEYGSLPNNGPYNALSATFTHELMHALGVYTSTYIEGDKFYLGESVTTGSNGETQVIINEFTKHIYDIYGTRAQAGMEIIPISIEEYTNKAIEHDPSKFYVFDRYKKDDSYQKMEFISNGGTSFKGDNVTAALTTDGALKTVPAINWPDNCPVPSVNGVPVNGIELNVDDNGEIYEFTEMAHLELQNSLLSHQQYRNWQTLMEAEIALLQDLGYNIDRKRFFGSSIYASDLENFVNTRPYYARLEDGSDWDGTNASMQDWGVGLHVYGSRNTITQAAPLLADGNYANGIRLEGQFNNLNIATNITANGKNGNGLLVSYGKKHNITLNEGASIIANGAGGVGARFDFGDNMLGQCGLYMEYRGSYYRLLVLDPVNRILATFPAISGELVTNFDVNGHLEGKEAAIYIAHNALVKNININKDATLKGDIISHWSPTTIPIEKISRGEYTTLVDYNTGQPISWDLKLSENEDGLTYIIINKNWTFTDNILGGESLVLNVANGKTFTSGQEPISSYALRAASTASNEATPVVNVYRIVVNNGATYNNNSSLSVQDSNAPSAASTGAITVDGGSFNNAGSLIVGNGQGTITVQNNGSFAQAANGSLTTTIDGAGNSTKFAIDNNSQATLSGTLNIVPTKDFYGSSQTIALLSESATGAFTIDDSLSINVLTTEGITAAASIDDNGNINITRQRHYDTLVQNDGQKQLGKVLSDNVDYLGALPHNGQKWQRLYTELEALDGVGKANALKQMNPGIMGSSAQAILGTHSMLNNMNMLGSFSNNIPQAATGGGRGPAASISPQYNSWRNIIMPFSAYTDQHRGTNGYSNHNNGVMGAMERTLNNGLTQGYHLAINHQSTSSAGQRIKGEGFYLGTQAKYAPAEWNGWQVFGSARLGLENMRSHRNLVLAGGSMGTTDADWNGFSGSFTLGTTLEKEHGSMRSGPFATLGYSFAHRPSVDEHGNGIPAHLNSATYDSLKTQLGYRLSTTPRALDSYDSTQWQAHASIAWNHELLSDNGKTSYQLADLPSTTITDTVETYGRDSMSIAAGITFKTPKRLDVGLTLGSDIYRHGGSSVYGKVNLEWKF